jgi:hypothetical protein
VFGSESFYFCGRDKVRAGQKEFYRIIAMFFSGGEAFGKRLMENEGAGGGLRNLRERNCRFHRKV